MVRHIAPAGSPIGLLDLARWGATALAEEDVAEAFRAAIRRRFAVRHCALTSTGRAGMTVILRAMRQLAPDQRDEVVLPSYTCYSLAASVVKAGLRLRIVDIDPATLDYDLTALQSIDANRVLAVVATNLYGMPNDMRQLREFTRVSGHFLIDDAAQAMGASIGGRWSGTWGDAGLFSLDKGKNLSAIDGGIIVTDDDALAQAIEQQMVSLVPPSATASARHIVKAVGYSVFLRPWLYGIPSQLPQLGLGTTLFTTDFPLGHADPTLTALALTMLRHLDGFTRLRVANATALLAALPASPKVKRVNPQSDASPVYLRLPILLPERATRDRVVAALTAAGIGATASYPASLADIAELESRLTPARPPAGAGRDVAARIVTLPTHPFVSSTDIARMAAIVAGALRDDQTGQRRQVPTAVH